MTGTPFNCPNCGAPLDVAGRAQAMARCAHCNSVIALNETLAPDSGALEQELTTLIGDGKKIEAIKRYREVYDSSLKEAKDAVEAMESGDLLESIRAAHDAPGAAPINQAEFEQEVLALVRSGQKIEAIKRYRQVYDVSLKAAKDVVEALESGDRLEAVLFRQQERPPKQAVPPPESPYQPNIEVGRGTNAWIRPALLILAFTGLVLFCGAGMWLVYYLFFAGG